MFKLRLLSLEETIAVAAKAAAQANRPPFDPTRALDLLSRDAILSMVVLVGQLDGVAQAAARAEALWHPDNEALQQPGAPTAVDVQAAADASASLIRLLLAAGYLPLPEIQEAHDDAR